jgi:tetratricopeptide (TPR) repeat protein
MKSLDNSPITWMYRPYFDLGDSSCGPLHTKGIDFSYHNLICSSASVVGNPVTLVHPFTFREDLIRETDQFQYKVSNPLELPDELRTARWNTLCDYLINYYDLPGEGQLRVINLLSSLCLHESVLKYIPVFSSTEIATSEILAELACCRAASNLMLQPDAGSVHNQKELETIAVNVPSGTQLRLNAITHLISFSAKVFSDLSYCSHWQALGNQELENLKLSLGDFEYKLQESVYYRAVVLLSMLQKDREKVIREMDHCEFLAVSLTHECQDEVERIAAHENLTTVYESRTKEALWLGDVDLAEERARKMISMEPLYSRFRLQLGEILIKQRKFEEASEIYRSAARLGPPGTAIAWYMAGQCHEKIGDLGVAFDCYLASVQMDELAISAVERLSRLAPHFNNLALLKWNEVRLQQLQDQQREALSQTRTSYISEACSELKLAGEQLMS